MVMVPQMLIRFRVVVGMHPQGPRVLPTFRLARFGLRSFWYFPGSDKMSSILHEDASAVTSVETRHEIGSLQTVLQ